MQLIPDRIQSVLDDIVKRLKGFQSIDKIVLFGSRARDDAEERSDIDIAILCPNATAREWLDVCEIVENTKTLLEIDVVRLDTASQELQRRVFDEGRILYEKN
ncbi:MAG: nucleotidyltransferase domain-containing protein [Gammaproteobacteria bacterium]|jgi:predicted nucleotidyltransferase